MQNNYQQTADEIMGDNSSGDRQGETQISLSTTADESNTNLTECCGTLDDTKNTTDDTKDTTEDIEDETNSSCVPIFDDNSDKSNKTIEEQDAKHFRHSFALISETDLNSDNTGQDTYNENGEKLDTGDEGMDMVDSPPNKVHCNNAMKINQTNSLSIRHHHAPVSTNHSHSGTIHHKGCEFKLIRFEDEKEYTHGGPPSCLVVDGPPPDSILPWLEDRRGYWECLCSEQKDSDGIITKKRAYRPRDFFDDVDDGKDERIRPRQRTPSSSFRKIFGNIFRTTTSRTTASATSSTTTTPLYSDDYYDTMNDRVRGHLSIINLKYFSNQFSNWECETRTGTNVDADQLTRLFLDLGFTVDRHDNPSTENIRDIVRDSAHQNYSEIPMSVCAVFSHGDSGKIRTKDGEIELNEIIAPYRQNKTLAGKPKMFIIQACRGDEYMGMIDDQVDGVGSDEWKAKRQSLLQLPLEADFLFAYSTVDGYLSWKNSEHGSWFVETLVRVFRAHALKMDVMRMLNRVNKIVADRFPKTNNSVLKRKKQMPCFVSQLTKDLFLIPPHGPLSLSEI